MTQELMQVELDAEHGAGVYRVRPIAWTVQESPRDDSQAVSISIAYGIVNEWHPEQKAWSAEWPKGWYVYGSHWIVNRDGTLNAGKIDALVKAGIWNGDFSVLEVDPPNSVLALATVEEDVYEGKTRFRVSWINPDADEPRTRGGFKPADPNVLASLRSRFQSQVRAIAGGGKQGGSPPAPPAGGPAPTTGGPGKEEVPF